MKVIQRRVIHEKHGIAEFLNSNLKAIGGSDRIVVGYRLSINKDGSIAVLRPDQEPPFYDTGKHQDSFCLFTDNLRRRIIGKKAAQGNPCVLGNLGCTGRLASVWNQIILVFLIIHLRDFWYQVQFGHLPLDKDGQEDLYTLVVTVYRNSWYVLIYVLCMVGLGYHLLHGFFSAARTLGIYHPRYANWIRAVGWVYSVGISAGFAVIPLYIYFAKL
jgi:hypothetical protein